MIYEDNTGCIYLVKNQQVGPRTKHIDVRHHYIRRQVSNEYIVVMFKRSEFNPSDILTKNGTEKLFVPHSEALLNGTLECWREDVENIVRQHLADTSPAVTSESKTRGGSLDSDGRVSPSDPGWKTATKRR